jgi:hypothetical protein
MFFVQCWMANLNLNDFTRTCGGKTAGRLLKRQSEKRVVRSVVQQ